MSCGTEVLARRQVLLPGQLSPCPRSCRCDPCCGQVPGSILSCLEIGGAGEGDHGCQVSVPMPRLLSFSETILLPLSDVTESVTAPQPGTEKPAGGGRDLLLPADLLQSQVRTMMWPSPTRPHGFPVPQSWVKGHGSAPE